MIENYDFLFCRIAYYVEISSGVNAQFLRGWLNRVLALREEVLRG